MLFLSILAFLIAGLGAAGAYIHILSPMFGAELVLGGLGLAVLAGLIRIILAILKKPGSWIPIPLALVSALGIGYFYFLSTQHPLTDLTTNPKMPPQFLHPVAKIHVGAGVENLDSSFYLQRPYKPENAAIQLARYPGIITIKFTFPLEEAFQIIEKTIADRYPDWKITLKDNKTFHLEAEVESTPFHFVDDVAIDLRPGTEGNTLDFRSRGRIEQTDLGMNAKRLYDMNSAFTFAFNKRQEEWSRLQKAATPVTPVSSATNPNQTITAPVMAQPQAAKPNALPVATKAAPIAKPAATAPIAPGKK